MVQSLFKSACRFILPEWGLSLLDSPFAGIEKGQQLETYMETLCSVISKRNVPRVVIMTARVAYRANPINSWQFSLNLAGIRVWKHHAIEVSDVHDHPSFDFVTNLTACHRVGNDGVVLLIDWVQPGVLGHHLVPIWAQRDLHQLTILSLSGSSS